jgi:hypothetical protein
VDRRSLLARVRKAAKENSVTFVGDERSGRFSHGMLKGEYNMVGEKVIFTIIDKPVWIPWPIVEAKLKELVS